MLFFVIGFVIGYVIVSLSMEVANSVIAALFVCQHYEETVLINHPELFARSLGEQIQARKQELSSRV